MFDIYLAYFTKLFDKLVLLNVILSFKKIYLNYFSIILLEQKVDVFNLFITKKRIIAIKTIKFFKNLKTLKIYLNLVNY